jgi:hypothetical protein
MNENSLSYTTRPIKNEVHDPFVHFGRKSTNVHDSIIELMFVTNALDPNKESQNVSNAIPQYDLYDPWGRPGAGAPLVHAPTGQKFTRYSGSLEDKLVCANVYHKRENTSRIILIFNMAISFLSFIQLSIDSEWTAWILSTAIHRRYQ